MGLIRSEIKGLMRGDGPRDDCFDGISAIGWLSNEPEEDIDQVDKENGLARKVQISWEARTKVFEAHRIKIKTVSKH
jgi:hypothetical protein